MEGGLGALRSRQTDGRDERIKYLERKLGQVAMDNALLEQKIEGMEEGLPLGGRRSRR